MISQHCKTHRVDLSNPLRSRSNYSFRCVIAPPPSIENIRTDLMGIQERNILGFSHQNETMDVSSTFKHQRASLEGHHGLNLVTMSQSMSSNTDGKPLTDQAILRSACQNLGPINNVGADRYRLQASPYSEADHLLDLGTLALAEQLLAIALTKMAPLDADYATMQYDRAFNWDKVVDELRNLTSTANLDWRRREYFIVIFRSQLKEDCDRAFITSLDKTSHREAVISGGLLKYWFGTPNSARRNLATCKYFMLLVRSTPEAR
jgi:hypothetical protein